MKVVARVGSALFLTLVVACTGFSQVQTVQTVQTVQAVPNRIPQPIIVNGQQVNGAHVSSPGGGMQTFTCPDPQEYVTPEGASRGWACFDASTGAWLLNSLPPASQPVAVQQPTVVYQPAPRTIVYQASGPAVVYAQPVQTVYVTRPVYSPSVVIGAAVIDAAGRIASAAIRGSYYPSRYYYSYSVRDRGYRGWRR